LWLILSIEIAIDSKGIPLFLIAFDMTGGNSEVLFKAAFDAGAGLAQLLDVIASTRKKLKK
jgi:hypothetical protein